MRSDEPLLHIGYHKTGTTWLQRQVFNDAGQGFVEAWPPDVVEDAFVAINPFSFDPAKARAALDRFAKEADEKDLTFVISHERLSGQPLQGGIDARELAGRLIESYPRGRVLIVIRDQRDMVMSVYKQITTRGLNRDTFEQFLTYRVSQGRLSPVIEFLEYHHLIGFYQQAFGDDRVLVLPYERLREPVEFVGDIAAFCGRPRPDAVPQTRENVALPTVSIATLRYFNIVLRTLGLERWLTGPRAKPKAVNARLKVIQKAGRLGPKGASKRIDARWRDATDRMLGDRLAASNATTSRLIGIDLGTYGYVMP